MTIITTTVPTGRPTQASGTATGQAEPTANTAGSVARGDVVLRYCQVW